MADSSAQHESYDRNLPNGRQMPPIYTPSYTPQSGDSDVKTGDFDAEIPQKAVVSNNLQRKLADFVQNMQAGVEMRSNGLPLYYVDASALAPVVPECDSIEDISQEVYSNALVPIEIESQGLISSVTGGVSSANFPCARGVPIWERLDGEPLDHYRMFQEYRDMKYIQDSRYNARSMARLCESHEYSAMAALMVSKMFHWALRVRWYDVYKELDFQLKKQKEIETLENNHAKIADSLTKKAMEYLEKHPNEITPKVAVAMLELGLRYGRISLGLQGDKPSGAAVSGNGNGGGSNAGGQGSSPFVNIAVASVNQAGTQTHTVSVTAGDNQGQVTEDKSAVERALAERMKNPETIIQVLHVLKKTGAMSQSIQDMQNAGNKDAGIGPVDEDGSGNPADMAGFDDEPTPVIEGEVIKAQTTPLNPMASPAFVVSSDSRPSQG